MSRLVIADSSCLIALSKTGRLDVLRQLFGRIVVAQAVYAEVVEKGAGRPGSLEVKAAEWIETRRIRDQLAVDALRLTLGAGESESIVLAVELKADYIILDDWQARRMAMGLSLPVVGTLAVLSRAVEKGYLDDLGSALEELRKVGFRFTVRPEGNQPSR